MQKKIIALAVAGLVSGAAFAQSNVTVYGVMDLTQEFVKTSGATVGAAQEQASMGRLASNSSYIGFKGSESLGNGLTAVFQVEQGFNADSPAGNTVANSTFATRDTYIGIAGGFGTVAAGNLTHPIRAMGAKVDNNPGSSSAGFTGSMYGEVLGGKTGSDDRAGNAVAYISPNFNGFTGVVAYVNLENSANGTVNGVNNQATKGHAWQIAGSYENGPLYVGLAWDKHTDPGALALVAPGLTDLMPVTTVAVAGAAAGGYNDNLKITRLATTYKLPSNTKLSFLWDKQKYDLTAAAINTNASRTAYMFGVNQEFGASNVWLQYAVAKDVSGDVCTRATAEGFASCGDTGAKQWTLGYSYSMSKRTMVHALYTKITNDRSASYNHYVNAVGAAGAAGADTTVYGVGLRHTF